MCRQPLNSLRNDAVQGPPQDIFDRSNASALLAAATGSADRGVTVTQAVGCKYPFEDFADGRFESRVVWLNLSGCLDQSPR